MANNVQKPTSTNYLTKLTSQASPPPSRDHQHNLNQKNPSPTAKENELRLVADFEQKITVDRLEANLKYTKERAHKAQIWEEDKARRLEEDVAHVADKARERKKQKQRDNGHYARMEARDAKHYARCELLMKKILANGYPPIKPPPASTPISIIDSLATTIICTDVPNIVKNTTTVLTTNTVHTINITSDQEFYLTCTTTNKTYDTNTSTITISDTNIESPTTTTDTTDTNSTTKTQLIIDTTTATTPPIVTLPTKTKI